MITSISDDPIRGQDAATRFDIEQLQVLQKIANNNLRLEMAKQRTDANRLFARMLMWVVGVMVAFFMLTGVAASVIADMMLAAMAARPVAAVACATPPAAVAPRQGVP